jgi:hypothetical protein
VNNPFDKEQTFRVDIEDPDLLSGVLKRQELHLLDNSKSEWEFWNNRGKVT